MLSPIARISSTSRGLTTIDENAFSGCDSLTNVTLPHGITTIGYAAFRYCGNLTSINLPDGLITIEPYAFYECWNLTSLELPHSVRNVSPSAFARCTSLTSVVFRPPVSRAAFHAWVVGKSRNRSNWELTTLQHTRNVLRLITVMSSWTRVWIWILLESLDFHRLQFRSISIHLIDL